MRRLVLALSMGLVLVPLLAAQDPARAVNAARMDNYKDYIRGKTVPMQQAEGIATPNGKTLDVRAIAKKTKELNDIVHSVDMDVINMSKGILAADLSEKLKKIEKLSKELRKSLE